MKIFFIISKKFKKEIHFYIFSQLTNWLRKATSNYQVLKWIHTILCGYLHPQGQTVSTCSQEVFCSNIIITTTLTITNFDPFKLGFVRSESKLSVLPAVSPEWDIVIIADRQKKYSINERMDLANNRILNKIHWIVSG